MNNWILAGDVGGTKINIALFAFSSAGLWQARGATYPTQEVKGLADVIADFLQGHEEKIDAACFGVAGPIENNRANMINVPWGIDARELAARCALPKVELINDLVATGYGINQLPREAIVTLNKGSEVLTANGALLAAGTGLGKAILLRTEAGWQPLPSEGGHSDFAPASELQIELLRYMRRRHGGCDLERVLSGPGLVHVYEFLHDTNRIYAPREFAERFKGEDGARIISEAALAGSPDIAVAALNLFVDIYAAAASNFAVECLATGGVWLGGGIAPKILPFLQRPEFMKAYMHRDRMLDVIEAIPVRVILDPRAALLGAAHHGAQLL